MLQLNGELRHCAFSKSQYTEIQFLQEYYHMGISVGPHTIRSQAKGWGSLAPHFKKRDGGSGVFVKARGLCDISRLPIWLGEWTPSNYSCSYCLINLPVSLLQPPPHNSLSFFPFFSVKELEEKKGLSGVTPQNTRDLTKKQMRQSCTPAQSVNINTM